MRKLLPALFTLAAAFLLRAPVPAQGQLDHLICYDVNDKLKPGVVVDLKAELQPEFSQLGCTVTKVTKFCVPATKTVVPPAPPGTNIVGQSLQNDYVCYQIDCPNSTKISDKLVIDQFGQRRERKFKPKELCVPARKADPPCFRIGTSKKCGGVCPNDQAGVGTTCRFDDSIDDCTCAPMPCGGKPDSTGHCGGECPDPLTCVRGVTATGTPACVCGNPPPPPCGINPATGTCGGTCDDPAAICQLVTRADGTVDCICQPPVDMCQKDTAGTCGGPCPAPLTCLLDTVINDCRCELPPQPCGPNPFTGQCGGECQTGMVCRFVSTPGTSPMCDCVTP